MGEHFLVVEDDVRVARHIARDLEKSRRKVLIAHTVQEACAMGNSLREMTGAVVDLSLPDGTGFDVARYLLARIPGLPVLVITATRSAELVNACQLLGVELVLKPTPRDNLQVFAERASWLKRVSNDQIARYAAQYALEHDLSRREQDVLGLALQGLGRREICEKLGRPEPTVKMQIRAMLRKTKKPTLGALVTHILMDAWLARNAWQS